MKLRLAPALLGSLACVSIACPTTTPQSDAAVEVDAAIPRVDAPIPDAPAAADAGVDAFSGSSLGTCAAPREVNLTLGEPITVRGDTSRGAAGALDLVNCGAGSPFSRPPQEVLAIRIPGSGMTAVRFDLTMDTDAEFDTVVQVRTTCSEAPTDPTTTCFDNVGESIQSAGSFAAMGGSTVYLVITGFDGAVSEGAYTATFTSIDNAPPTLNSVSARRINGERLVVRGDGADADSNAVGFVVEYLDASGALIRGAAGTGPFALDFDADFRMPTFSAVATQALVETDPLFVMAASLRVSVVDELGATSAPRTVSIEDRVEVDYGEACDAMRFCVEPNVCTAGICQATMAIRDACTAATTIPLVTPTTTATIAHQTAALPVGDGLFTGACAGGGAERLFNVTVPAGRFDLIATTLVDGTRMMLDTAIHIRSVCGNQRSEVACSDDAGAEGDLRSRAEVESAAPGNYTVFIDTYAPLADARVAAFDVILRPVLASGAACDPMGVNNRCEGELCPAAGAAVCP
jgi:hypothetical protein